MSSHATPGGYVTSCTPQKQATIVAWRKPAPAHPMENVSSQRDRERLLLVDDHPIMRHGLVQLISAEDDFEV